MTFTLLMSYFGLFLMSQVNPGEFCPMPYAAIAMTYFALMEKDTKSFKEIFTDLKAKFAK